jgi:hypothetical protein
VHAGASLIKWPPVPKVVQTNTAAVHAGETLIKWPPSVKVVHSNTAAVHAGETLIKWPPPVKAVHSNTAAVHAGASLIKWPPVPTVVHTHVAAVDAGETLITPPTPPLPDSWKAKSPPSKPWPSNSTEIRTAAAPPTPVRIPKPKVAPSSSLANATTGAVTHEQNVQRSTILSKAARPDRSKMNDKFRRKLVEPNVERKAKPTKVKVTKIEKSKARMATKATPVARIVSRPARSSDGNEVRRAIGQLNNEDSRAFRSRCGQILSAPGKFARTHVEVCTAASL